MSRRPLLEACAKKTKVIDHRTSIPVHQLLTEKHSSDKFDVIIDAYGVQSLFDNCTSFLKENGSYITVGVAFDEYTYGSMMVAISRMMKNIMWPRILGGAPRQYVQVASACSLQGLERLKRLCEEGKLKVAIDSVWDFLEIAKVSSEKDLWGPEHLLTDNLGIRTDFEQIGQGQGRGQSLGLKDAGREL